MERHSRQLTGSVPDSPKRSFSDFVDWFSKTLLFKLLSISLPIVAITSIVLAALNLDLGFVGGIIAIAITALVITIGYVVFRCSASKTKVSQEATLRRVYPRTVIVFLGLQSVSLLTLAVVVVISIGSSDEEKKNNSRPNGTQSSATPPSSKDEVSTPKPRILNNTVVIGPRWVDTLLTIEAGARVTVAVTGEITATEMPGRVSDPDGIADVSAQKCPLINENRYRLIAVIGDVRYTGDKFGNRFDYYALGKMARITAKITGKLYLGVNDHDPWNNGGSYSLVIEGVGSKQLSIPGHSGFWTDTGIDALSGETVRISASGIMDIGGVGETSGPEGYPPDINTNQSPLPGQNRYAPIGVIGNYQDVGEYFFIGRDTLVSVKAPGRLYIGINDHQPWDNTGSFIVEISVSE